MGKQKSLNSVKKVFCVGSNYDAAWLPREYITTTNYEKADVVIFPGGSDWNPALYNQTVYSRTGFYPDIDKRQLHYALRCLNDKKFMIGICRGGQMACILAGGELIQDVECHAGRDHEIITTDGHIFWTNSIHHQMMDTMRIPEKDFELLAWTTPLSSYYKHGNGEAVDKNGELYRESLVVENEIIYFKTIGAFAIQGHPEMGMNRNTTEWIIEQINTKYDEFQRSKAKKPKYVKDRQLLVEQIVNHTKIKNQTYETFDSKETDWSTSVQDSREWSY